MKKLFVAILLIFTFFSASAYASEGVPAVYFNGSAISSSDAFVSVDSTLYIDLKTIPLIFGIKMSVVADGDVFTFSNFVRNVTYDTDSGTMNIGDKNSFLSAVYPGEFPSYTANGKIYAPINMICTAFHYDIRNDERRNSVYISSYKYEIGLFNNDGTAIAYRSGNFGLVSRDGTRLTKFDYDAISNYDNPSLFRVTRNHRIGLCNSEGEALTDLIYDEITYESPDRIYLEKNNSKGVCDGYGNIIIPVKFDDVIYCDNKIAMIKNGRYWYVYDARYDTCSDKPYDEVYRITAGIHSDNPMIKGYYVVRNNKWGCVDSFGNTVIDIVYEGLDKFDNSGRARVVKDGKMGIIDCGGRIIIPVAYDYIYPFGNLSVTVAQVGNKYGVLSTTGEIVVPFEYDYLYSFNDSHSAVAYKDGKFGLVATDGTLVTEFKYEYMDDFKNNLAIAYDGGYGYIDHYGNEVIPCTHEEVKQGTTLSVFLKKDDKWALYSPTGHQYTGFDFEDAGAFSNGLSAVSVLTEEGELYGYVNDSGDVIIPFKYNQAQQFKYGKAIVRSGRYSGIIDVEGNEVIPFVYTGFNPSYDYEVIAAADENGKWGLISLTNDKLSEFEFDYIFEFENGYAPVLKNHSYGVMDTKGRLVTGIIYKTKEKAMSIVMD